MMRPQSGAFALGGEQMQEIREALLCLLRVDILAFYRKWCDGGDLSEDEYETVEKLVRAYNKLGGDSLGDGVWEQVAGDAE